MSFPSNPPDSPIDGGRAFARALQHPNLRKLREVAPCLADAYACSHRVLLGLEVLSGGSRRQKQLLAGRQLAERRQNRGPKKGKRNSALLGPPNGWPGFERAASFVQFAASNPQSLHEITQVENACNVRVRGMRLLFGQNVFPRPAFGKAAGI